MAITQALLLSLTTLLTLPLMVVEGYTPGLTELHRCMVDADQQTRTTTGMKKMWVPSFNACKNEIPDLQCNLFFREDLELPGKPMQKNQRNANYPTDIPHRDIRCDGIREWAHTEKGLDFIRAGPRRTKMLSG